MHRSWWFIKRFHSCFCIKYNERRQNCMIWNGFLPSSCKQYLSCKLCLSLGSPCLWRKSSSECPPTVCTSAPTRGAQVFIADVQWSLPPGTLLSPSVAALLMISVVILSWQLQEFSDLLCRVAGGTYSFKDWETFNDGKIAGRVWIKTAFKLLTFPFPRLLLIVIWAGTRWES